MSVYEKRAPRAAREEFPDLNFPRRPTRLCCEGKPSSFGGSLCSPSKKKKRERKRLRLSPPSLMTPDKRSVFLQRVSRPQQHSGPRRLGMGRGVSGERGEGWRRRLTDTVLPSCFREMNRRLGDQYAPAVDANNGAGAPLSGARCQSVASGACTFPGYTIGL